MRKELKRTESIEDELKRTVEIHSRERNELKTTKEQLTRIQNELYGNQIRKQETESELINARSEVRDFRQRINELNNKIGDLNRQIQDSQINKNRNEEKIRDLEKQNVTQKLNESELKKQYEVLKNEKKQLIKEISELKEKCQQIKLENDALGRAEGQCKTEKAFLLKKIQMYEIDKRRTDEAIRETALQREAIEKSLNAMERENRELYKNCAQLQQQVAQLEMENGNRLMEISKIQKEEQEKQIQRMRNEKAQFEKILESRERLCKEKIRQLENQIQILRESLESERRKGRNLRTVDISRVQSGVSDFWPSRSDNIDSFRFRRTFASNPLTPPRGTSTPIREVFVVPPDREDISRSETEEQSVSTTPRLDRAHGFDQKSISGAFHPIFPGRELAEEGPSSMEQLKYSRSGL